MTTSTTPILFEEQKRVPVRALFLSERIDVRAVEHDAVLAEGPLMLRAGRSGCAVLFRYGAAVLFGVRQEEEQPFLDSLRSVTTGSFPSPESEAAELAFDAHGTERVGVDGVIVLREPALERLQIVADILAKSIVLAHYETSLAKVFDKIEPLAVSLQRKGRSRSPGKQLLQQIGDVLLIRHRMVGRVEVGEKPELLWEHPGLDRLYARLAEEYELRERGVALDRKLDLIYRTAETFLQILQDKRSLRVEWYIVILILVEILLSIYATYGQ